MVQETNETRRRTLICKQPSLYADEFSPGGARKVENNTKTASKFTTVGKQRSVTILNLTIQIEKVKSLKL